MSQNTDISLALCFMGTSTTFFGFSCMYLWSFSPFHSPLFYLCHSSFMSCSFFCCGSRIGDKVMILIIVEIQ